MASRARRSGWMDKQGMSFPRTWKTRFFYLSASSDGSVGVLSYYTAEHAQESEGSAKEKKGAISLAGARVSHTLLGRVQGRHDHGFAIVLSSGKVLNLSAQSASERKAWLAELMAMIGDGTGTGRGGGGPVQEASDVRAQVAAAASGANKAAQQKMRGLVSKKKVRFVEEDFDLDLTYIDDERRIIAMGFPSVGVEAAYRNPMKEVQRFFKHYHAGHFLIFNLCSERAYEASQFQGHVERHPFNDHNPCPLQVVYPFCEAAAAFLEADPLNVVAIHCKAGKGRTGLMIAALLVHMKYIHQGSPADATQMALRHFGDRRTHNGKGVTIPSQMRMVRYYAECRAAGQTMRNGPKLRITSIHLTTAPNFDTGGGCDPYFKLERFDAEQGVMVKAYSMIKECKRVGRKLKHALRGEPYMIDCSDFDVVVENDVKLTLFDKDLFGGDDKMCAFWFHTAFLPRTPDGGGASLTLTKSEIDKACKSKGEDTFPSEFGLTVTFALVEEAPAEGASVTLRHGRAKVPSVEDARRSLRVAKEEEDDDEIEIEGQPAPADGVRLMHRTRSSVNVARVERNSACWWFKRVYDVFDPAHHDEIDGPSARMAFVILGRIGLEMFATVEGDASAEKARADELFAEIDTDGDGCIQFEEFDAFLTRVLHLPGERGALEFDQMSHLSDLFAKFEIVVKEVTGETIAKIDAIAEEESSEEDAIDIDDVGAVLIADDGDVPPLPPMDEEDDALGVPDAAPMLL